jgi:hypothetical protein
MGRVAAAPRQITKQDLIVMAHAAGREHGVDPALLLAIAAQESSLNPYIEDGDHGRSRGLFQFWDPTINWLRDSLKITGNPYDPESAFMMAGRYLAYLDRHTPAEDFIYAEWVGMNHPDPRNGEARALGRAGALGAMFNGGWKMFANRRPIRKPSAIAYGRDIAKRVRLYTSNDPRWALKRVHGVPSQE